MGITSPSPFEAAERHILQWLGDGHNGEMAWLNEARTRLATHPDKLLQGAKSLVVVGVNYRADEATPRKSGRVARYAWGSDYHDVIKARLRLLAGFLGPDQRARVFVDSGPLVERDAAVRAGLGFRGKNTNLLTPIGSYVFLAALLTTVELEFDQPTIKDCGTCTLCLDACPTQALDQPYHLQAERCISYLTIEHRGPIASELRPEMRDWIFGCDICQEVCPYNASPRNKPRTWPEFEPRPLCDLPGLLALDDEAFRTTFKGSPVKRAKRRGLARNVAIALGNSGDARALPALEEAAHGDPEPLVREAAEWSIRQLQATTAETRASG
ncbi:MAG TPA: tRNA epoxyqueuosine(34) reductase QueG [Chloroflexota bacterium]|nr:tRNA epoxyqueuosine(34) reductase QueG [Chloroflexota bacterium]